MIVIAIIGILAAALFPAIENYLGRGRDASRVANLKDIALALTNFVSDKVDSYPAGPVNCDISAALFPFIGKVLKDTIPTRNHGCGPNGFYGYGTWIININDYYAISADLESAFGGYWYATGGNNPFTGDLSIADINNVKYNLIKWSGSLYVISQ